MIYQEALKAMKKRIPVKVGGIFYKRINAIIFRKTDTKEYIELELQDKKNTKFCNDCKYEPSRGER